MMRALAFRGHMKITVRLAKVSDLDAVENLYGELNDYLAEPNHVNYPRWSRGIYPLREHAEEGLNGDHLYVAEYQGKIVGTVIFLYEQEEVYQSVDWQIGFDVPVIVIHVLAVHPAYFGCGVGETLLDYAANLGRKQGVKAIRLDTYEENLPAVRLYEKCGFQYMGMIDLGLEEIYGLKWYKVFEKVLYNGR